MSAAAAAFPAPKIIKRSLRTCYFLGLDRFSFFLEINVDFLMTLDTDIMVKQTKCQ